MALRKGEERATRPCPILFRQQFQSTWYHDSIFCPTVWSSSQQEHRISVSSNHHHRRRRFTSTLFCYIIDNRVVVRVPVEYLRWIHLKPNPNPMMLIITNKSRRQMIFHPPDFFFFFYFTSWHVQCDDRPVSEFIYCPRRGANRDRTGVLFNWTVNKSLTRFSWHFLDKQSHCCGSTCIVLMVQ